MLDDKEWVHLTLSVLRKETIMSQICSKGHRNKNVGHKCLVTLSK